MSTVVMLIFDALEVEAPLTECALKIEVSTPAISRNDLSYWAIMVLEVTGL